MQYEHLSKDVWVLILKRLNIKELIGMREVSKYFNSIVKHQFHRFWFRRYIDLIIRTGTYAKKYNVNIPKIHNYSLYVKECDLYIPSTTCYTNNVTLLKAQHKEEYDQYMEIGKELLSRFPNEKIAENRLGTLTKTSFPTVFALTHIIKNHCSLLCPVKYGHYDYDLPKGDDDDEWFDSHQENLVYDKKMCYLSHYLMTVYRIKRDNLDHTDKWNEIRQDNVNYDNNRGYTYKKRSRIMKDDFRNCPFYNKKLTKFKII